MTKLLDLMTGAWAVMDDTLAEMQNIYATHLRGEKIDVQAIEARLGRPLANEQQEYEIQPGGVAVLRASGVMAPKANILMQVSGGISTQLLARQFDSMAADPRVRSVVFAPDSPGGNVLGIPALTRSFEALAAAKPTVTVGEGVISSAMYWVASAANAMFIEGETDMVGSIGVIKTIGWQPEKPNERTLVRGRFKRTSVNGQAPAPEVLAFEEAQLDYLYTLFVETVAQHRGTSTADVLDRMADGRVFIGQQAIDSGLVDGVSTVADMVERLATNPDAFAKRRKATFALVSGSSPSASAGAAPKDDITPTTPEKGHVMPHDAIVSRESLQRDHAELFAALQTEFTAQGAAAERGRIQAVMALDAELPGHSALLKTLAFDGTSTAEQASLAVIRAEGKARTAHAAAHAADAPAAVPSSAAPADKPLPTRAEQVQQAKDYANAHDCSFVEACTKLGIGL